MDREDRLRYTAFKANLMTSFVKKLSVKQKVHIPQEAKGKNNPLHDNTKYVNAASTLFNKYSAQEFKDRTGLDPAYRILLQNCRKFVEARHKWAHETDDEFARLLLSRQFQEESFKTGTRRAMGEALVVGYRERQLGRDSGYRCTGLMAVCLYGTLFHGVALRKAFILGKATCFSLNVDVFVMIVII